jgi:hypothetical protein
MGQARLRMILRRKSVARATSYLFRYDGRTFRYSVFLPSSSVYRPATA